MDSLIFELQIVFYFQLFLSANVRHIYLEGLIFAILRYLYRCGHFLSLAASSSLFEEFMSALTSFPDTRHIFDVIARYEKVRAVKLMT